VAPNVGKQGPTSLCTRKAKKSIRESMSDSEPVVLIVEDESDVAETYRLWLEDSYGVKMAKNGDEGLAKLDETVDVVLLDRMMPGLSGGEVLEEIRSQELDCRVAMVTAVEPDFDILEMGFDAYLSKPVKSDQLQTTVENLLERSEYDSLLQEYYSLVEKQATLEATKDSATLEESDEYAALRDQITALRQDLSETLGGIEDDDDFIATIRGLSDVEEN
jgi:DNA-binding response OmpR family regulator